MDGLNQLLAIAVLEKKFNKVPEISEYNLISPKDLEDEI